MRPRLPFWTLILTLLFLVQLGWWGLLLWGQAKDLRDSKIQTLHATLEHADGLWQQQVPQTEATWQALAPQFAEIVWAPGPEAMGSLQINAKNLGKINQQYAATQRMIMSESGLFLALAGLGVALLFRTLRRESYLALQQSNFLHAVTHEFRSPLQGVRLAAETIARRPEGAKDQEYAEDVLADVTRLEALVDNLLEVGRLDARGFQAYPVATNFQSAIIPLVANFQKNFREDTQVQLSTDETPIFAQVDISTLAIIVVNLLDNARKYGEGKTIQVEVGMRDGFATFAVQDFGKGIARTDLPHVFERFWRAGDEKVRTTPGVGLGLFLVQQLGEAQGAQIYVHSEGLGQGSLFKVCWPLAKEGEA